jgi:hypothetical protein
MIDPRRGDGIVALQELTVAMRKDIQLSPFQKKMSPADIKHLFVRLNRQ